MSNLSDKHKLFIEEYISNNCNATKAYMAVYNVDPESARREGSRLLSNVDIKTKINERIDEILADKKVLTMQVIDEYKKLAFSNISDYLDPLTWENIIDENTDTRAIESIQYDIIKYPNKENPETREKFKFKLYNKQSALDSISKLILGFAERHALTDSQGNDILPINININGVKS